MKWPLTERKRQPATLPAAVLASVFFFFPLTAKPACIGDCDGDGVVTVNEVVTLVRVLLGQTPLGLCAEADVNGDGAIDVAEIVKAVRSLLVGCAARCGNGLVEEDEECDDGGICLGTSKAGSFCRSDSECLTTRDEWKGVCRGGERPYTACNSDSDCPQGRCVACWTFGGDGCAANCTEERQLRLDLEASGSVEPDMGSYITIYQPPGALSLPLNGSFDVAVGRERNGRKTFTVPVASAEFAPISISTLACACFRLTEYKTCGGAVFAPDGSLVEQCNEGFAVPPANCPDSRPCVSVFGPGNAGSGVVGCEGLALANLDVREISPDGPIQTRYIGVGSAGTSLLALGAAVGSHVGRCTEQSCTEADPPATRGAPSVNLFTTGQACARRWFELDEPGSEQICVQGSPIACGRWESGELAGLRFCTTYFLYSQVPGLVRAKSCLQAK